MVKHTTNTKTYIELHIFILRHSDRQACFSPQSNWNNKVHPVASKSYSGLHIGLLVRSSHAYGESSKLISVWRWK